MHERLGDILASLADVNDAPGMDGYKCAESLPDLVTPLRRSAHTLGLGHTLCYAVVPRVSGLPPARLKDAMVCNVF